MNNNGKETISNLLMLIKEYDLITFNHIINVYKIMKKYCEFYNVPNAINLINGALMHDVGKLYIDKEILNKEGRLTDEEFLKMRKHTLLGYKLLKSKGISKDVYIYSLYHHYRADGKNIAYDFSKEVNNEDLFQNVKEYQKNISLMNICDSFEAMIAKRTYNKPKSLEEAISEIKKYSGTQFDVDIANKFIYMFSPIEKKKFA